MRRITLIRGARQLLTLRGPNGPRRGADLNNLGIIHDGAVLITDGAIAEVGPSRRLENLAIARGAEEIDASGCVVLPGFVASDVQLVSNTSELSPRVLKALALHAVEEAIRHGTTAIEATAGPELTAAAALKILRVHAALRELPFTFVSTLLTSDPQLLAMPRLCRLANLVEVRGNASNLAQARQLVDSGEAIVLASGGANMQTAIALACLAANLTPAEAISACTINAAHAIGRASSVGSIEAGKSADLIILAAPDYRELPYHFGVNLAGINLVKLVMIRGTVRVERPPVRWP
jgi:imidazolonepropionase-like amidohydrolase